jgi:hypothetical protein
MTVTHNTATRTDVAALLATIYGENATLRLYSAAQVNPNIAAVGTLLVTITLPVSPYATAANGAALADVLWTGMGVGSLSAPTVAVGFRFASADGSRVTIGTVGLNGSGADLEMDNTSIAANQEVRVTAAELLALASGA